MDVTKQKDLSLFYRNILQQTTGSVPDEAVTQAKVETKPVTVKQEQEW